MHLRCSDHRSRSLDTSPMERRRPLILWPSVRNQQGRPVSSSRPRLRRQTGPISRCVIRNRGTLHEYPNRALPPQLRASSPFLSTFPSPPLCDFVPCSFPSPPSLTFCRQRGRTVSWPSSTFDVADHLADGPTGPPGKYQSARRPSSLLSTRKKSY